MARPEHHHLATLHEQLVEYRAPMRSYFARRVGSRTEAEDLTHEVFARVLKRAENGPIENVEGYLFYAAANLLRELGRQRLSRSSLSVLEMPSELVDREEVGTPERILIGRETIRRVTEALLELPERTRSVFIMHRFEEMKGHEIARRLGISSSAVEKHMMRALAHLRTIIR